MEKPEKYWKKEFNNSAINKMEDYSIAHWSEYGLQKRIYEFKKIFNNTKPLKKEALILDAGCGTGVYSIEILKSGYDVVACDYSENMIALIRKKIQNYSYPNKIFLTIQDVNKLSFMNSVLDYILCMGVLQHLTKADYVIKEFANVLKPGGLAVINTMHSKFLIKRGGKYFHWYNPQYLAAIAIKNGFKTCEIKYLYLLPKLFRRMEPLFENYICNKIFRFLAHDFFIILKK